MTKQLTPTQPFLILQSHIHSHTSLTKLLPSWASALGLLIKGLKAWVQSRLEPCPKEEKNLKPVVPVLTFTGMLEVLAGLYRVFTLVF